MQSVQKMTDADLQEARDGQVKSLIENYGTYDTEIWRRKQEATSANTDRLVKIGITISIVSAIISFVGVIIVLVK